MKNFLERFLHGGGNPKKEHFVLQGGTLRFIFSEHFVLRIINKKGFIDKNGKNVTPCVYDVICDFNEKGLALVQKDNKWGYVNIEGKEVVPCVYDIIDVFNDAGIAGAERDGKHGLIDMKGNSTFD